MPLRLLALPLAAVVLLAPPAAAQTGADASCRPWDPAQMRRNPTEAELRCRFGAHGPGRFGLLSYIDVPVYQPATPMPGTHVVGVAGHAKPLPGESYEAWEWRMLRTRFGAEALRVHRGLEVMDPFVASRIMRLEARLAAEGIRAVRRETWRAPERQAYIFQQGRSRPGPIATATLTSWHSHVDEKGRPAGRAADYDVSAAQMRRFHEIARAEGLQSFGGDSFDPGHVFLPAENEVPVQDLVLLRVLPRVPEVTLSTGLPTDRPLPPGGRKALREASLEFAREYFVAFPLPALASDRPRAEPRLEVARPAPVAAVCEVSRRGARKARAAGGGAPCESRRSAAHGSRKSDRSTGG